MSLKILFRSLVGLPAFEIPQSIDFFGQNGPISIRHDPRTGIPQVKATTLLDAVFGQGYISGLHRAFQMELNRRTAAARLSEISGPATLDIDRWICRLGIPDAVEASMRQVLENGELLQILQSYSAGVNLAWKEYPCPSFEYALLRISPKPWTPEDCIRIVTLLSWSLAGNWQEQLVRLQCIETLGPHQAASLSHRLGKLLSQKSIWANLALPTLLFSINTSISPGALDFCHDDLGAMLLSLMVHIRIRGNLFLLLILTYLFLCLAGFISANFRV